MSTKREQALHMYINENCTQRHIAQTIGVSERTIYNWINDNAWDRLKKASYAAPAMIADNLCFQIVNMQEAIAGRAQNQQFPTMQEAEIIRKLITCLEKLKRYPTIGQNMQILETFRRFVWNGSPTDAAAIDRWKSRFIEGNAKNGFLPHEIEYNANYITPFTFSHNTPSNDIEPTPPVPTSFTPEVGNFPQSEITQQNTSQHTENQLVNSANESEPNQKKSEIPQQPTQQPSGKFPTLHELLAPLRKHKEDLLREAELAMQNQTIGNSHQSEITPQNNTQHTENQSFNYTHESATSRQKSEIPQHTTPHPTIQPTIQPTSQPTSFPPGRSGWG